MVCMRRSSRLDVVDIVSIGVVRLLGFTLMSRFVTDFSPSSYWAIIYRLVDSHRSSQRSFLHIGVAFLGIYLFWLITATATSPTTSTLVEFMDSIYVVVYVYFRLVYFFAYSLHYARDVPIVCPHSFT